MMKIQTAVILCSLAVISSTALQLCGNSNFRKWKVVGKFCVKYFENKYRFNEAENYCENLTPPGFGFLVSVHSLQENQDLSTIIPGRGAWIGLNATMGKPHWTDGQPVDYNNLQGRLSGCAQITDSGHWIDTQCDHRLGFVCRIPNRG